MSLLDCDFNKISIPIIKRQLQKIFEENFYLLNGYPYAHNLREGSFDIILDDTITDDDNWGTCVFFTNYDGTIIEISKHIKMKDRTLLIIPMGSRYKLLTLEFVMNF